MSVMAFTFGWPGPAEMIIILVICVLLFGSRLPSVMRSMGSSIVQFKKGLNDVEDLPGEIKKDIEEAVKKE